MKNEERKVKNKVINHKRDNIINNTRNIDITMSKTNQGITIIALTITIIVMLILAGIVIYIFSNQGPIEHAKFAQFSTELREIEEKVELYAADKQIEQIQNNGEITRRRSNTTAETKKYAER